VWSFGGNQRVVQVGRCGGPYDERVGVGGGTWIGMMSTWPTSSVSALASALASTMASTVTLYFRAMLDRISPLSTVCMTGWPVAVAVAWRVGVGATV
jgi:hypothetical protein